MEIRHLQPHVFVDIALAILPSIIAFGILILVARARTSYLWLVPGWLAAAAIAPVIGTFFGVRLIISAFSAMALSGGGIGAVSAGLWEAMQPSLFANYVASGLALITVIIAIRGVINAETSEEESSTGPAIISIVVLIVAVCAVAYTSHLLLALNGTVIDIIDPHGPPVTAGIASTSQMIANRLTGAAFFAAASFLLLIVAIVVVAVVDPKGQPGGLGLLFAFASILSAVGLVANVAAISGWCSRLQQIALTGQVVR